MKMSLRSHQNLLYVYAREEHPYVMMDLVVEALLPPAELPADHAPEGAAIHQSAPAESTPVDDTSEAAVVRHSVPAELVSAASTTSAQKSFASHQRSADYPFHRSTDY